MTAAVRSGTCTECGAAFTVTGKRGPIPLLCSAHRRARRKYQDSWAYKQLHVDEERRRQRDRARDAREGGAFASWRAMVSRCLNKNDRRWSDWGGRGIGICARWLPPESHGYMNFIADMGPRPEGRTLDRIDNDGNYEPANCRWATAQEQSTNRGRRD